MSLDMNKKPEGVYVHADANFFIPFEDVWPDGDAPENPTLADVLSQMKGQSPDDWGFYADWQVQMPGSGQFENWPFS